MNYRRKTGQAGERAVAVYLEQHGFTILARNYTKRYGEVDLIARNGALIAFVEVKARAREQFDLSTLITPSKQKKIIATAKTFLVEYELSQVYVRFDAALVIGNAEHCTVTYIENAFTEL